jgi:hypothetical protein
MQKWQHWEMAGEAAWGVALHRETVIRSLAEQPREHCRIGVSIGAEPKRSLQAPATLAFSASSASRVRINGPPDSMA